MADDSGFTEEQRAKRRAQYESMRKTVDEMNAPKSAGGVNRQGKPLSEAAKKRAEQGYQREKKRASDERHAAKDKAETERILSALKTRLPSADDIAKKLKKPSPEERKERQAEKDSQESRKVQKESIQLQKQANLRRQGFVREIGKLKITSAQQTVGILIVLIALVEIGFAGKIGQVWGLAFKTKS